MISPKRTTAIYQRQYVIEESPRVKDDSQHATLRVTADVTLNSNLIAREHRDSEVVNIQLNFPQMASNVSSGKPTPRVDKQGAGKMNADHIYVERHIDHESHSIKQLDSNSVQSIISKSNNKFKSKSINRIGPKTKLGKHEELKPDKALNR